MARSAKKAASEPAPERPLTADQRTAFDAATGHLGELFAATPSLDEHTQDPGGYNALWLQRVNPETRTVSILGDRGTGKTVVLMEVLNWVKQDLADQALVLPILDATIAAPEDSLRFSVMHVLDDVLCRQWQEPASNVRTSSKRGKAGKPAEGPADNGRRSLFETARTCLAEAKNAMVGTDPAWRKETAHLSAAQHDFAAWSRDRVDGTLGFPVKFRSAVEALLKLTGHKVAVLPLDDVDLAPQRFLQIVEVLNELRYCPEVVVVIAADPYDAVRRVHRELRRDGGGRPAIDADAEQAAEHTMAHRIVAKLLPLRYRCHLFSVPARSRCAFPPTGEGRAKDIQSEESIGRLLMKCGLATQETVFPSPVSDLERLAPNWGAVLPPAKRQLKELSDELRATAAIEFLPGEDLGGDKAWIGARLSRALAVVARFAGYPEWAWTIDHLTSELGRLNTIEESLLLHEAFELAAPVPEDVRDHARELDQLAKNLWSGASLARWLPQRPGGALQRGDGAAEPEVSADAFGPLCMDVLLRCKPNSRLETLLGWPWARQILEQHRIDVRQVHDMKAAAGREHPWPAGMHGIMQTWLHGAYDTPQPEVPLAASWVELIELLRIFAGSPEGVFRFPAGALRAIDPKYDAHLAELFGRAPLRQLPERMRDESGYVQLLAQLHAILRIRCALAAERTRTHDEVIWPYPRRRTPPDVIWLSDMLAELATPPCPTYPRPSASTWDRSDAEQRYRPFVDKDDDVDRSHESTLARSGRPQHYLDPKTGYAISRTWTPTEIWHQLIGLLPIGPLFSPKTWAERAGAVRELEDAVGRDDTPKP